MTDAHESFAWRETYRLLAERHELAVDDRGIGYVACAADGTAVLRFEPPRVLPLLGRAAGDYLRDRDAPGRQIVLLVQAGATAIGVWQDDDLLAHKVITKYVVRGRGRAQPTHLKTKGKSRAGSRLRLRNAQVQLVETNEKLCAYFAEHGAPRLVHYSVPVRIWPQLFRVDPEPPFGQRDVLLRRIPVHVHAPRFEELLRVRGRLARGRIIWLAQ